MKGVTVTVVVEGPELQAHRGVVQPDDGQLLRVARRLLRMVGQQQQRGPRPHRRHRAHLSLHAESERRLGRRRG